MKIYQVCLAVMSLMVFPGCASQPSRDQMARRSTLLSTNAIVLPDRVLQRRLRAEIYRTQSELYLLVIQPRRTSTTGVRIEVRANGIPASLPEQTIRRALDLQARLDGLLGQYAVQYGVQQIWCEDPSRERMPFVGLPRYEDLEHRVQCVMADPEVPGGRRMVEPYITVDVWQLPGANALLESRYETVRYPLPPPPVVPSPRPRAMVCHVEGE